MLAAALEVAGYFVQGEAKKASVHLIFMLLAMTNKMNKR